MYIYIYVDTGNGKEGTTRNQRPRKKDSWTIGTRWAIPLISININGNQWISTEVGYPWTSMDIHGNQ